MGSIPLFIFIYFLSLLYLFGFQYWYTHFTGRGIKFKKALIRRLIFSEIIILLIESLLEMVLSGYLNVYIPKDTTVGEVVGVYVAYGCLFISLIIFPLIFLWIIYLPF